MAEYNSESGTILLEASSGRILSGTNYDKRLFMASTTKLVTAIVAIENCVDIEKVFVIPSAACGIEGSSIYLHVGEKWRIIDLLYGLMLRSGNDAAVALAMAVCGDSDTFVAKMNELVNSLNLKNTHFVNPHGLHDDNHYTSAFDLASLCAYAYNNDLFVQLASASVYHAGTPDTQQAVFYNKNRLLSSLDGANGVKTGYTRNSGRCFVGAAEREGMQLIAVCLNISDMFEQAQALLEYGFSEYVMTDLNTCYMNNAVVINGERQFVKLRFSEPCVLPLKRQGSDSLSFSFIPIGHTNAICGEGGLTLHAPIKNGQSVAKVEIYDDNLLLFRGALCTMQNIDVIQHGGHFLSETERWLEIYENQ